MASRTTRISPTFVPRGAPVGLLETATIAPLDQAINAIERMGQRGASIAAAADAERDVMSGGSPEMMLGITPAGQAYNEAAIGAYETRTSMDLRAKANELAARFTGNNPTDPRAFSELFDGYANEVVSAVPQSVRPKIAFEARIRRDEAVADITGRALANQRRLQVSEMELGFKTSVIDAEDRAKQGKHDLADIALAQSFNRVDTMVKAGAISEGEGGLLKNQAKARMAAGTIFGGFMSGNLSGEAIMDGSVGGDLPGDVREELIRDVKSEMAHRRSEESHRLAVIDHTITANGRALDGLNKKQEHGIPLTEEEVRVRDAIINSGMVAPDKHAEGVAVRATADVNRTVATMTQAEIDKQAADWAANPPTSEAEFLIRERATKAFDKRRAGLEHDAAAYSQAVLPQAFPPVVFPDRIDAPEMDAALAQASRNLGLMRSHFGGNPNPLTLPQQKIISETLERATPPERAAMHGKIEAAFGPDAWIIQSGLRKNGALVDARVGAMVSGGHGLDAADVLAGDELIKQGSVKINEGDFQAAAVERGLLAAVGGNARAESEIRQAAMALAAKMTPSDPLKSFGEALAKVGGEVGYYNGGEVLLPIGVTETQFLDRLAGMTISELDAMTGGAGGNTEAALAISSGSASLESRGDGKYRVRIGNEYFLDGRGAFVLLDFAKIADKTPRGRSSFLPDVAPVSGAAPDGR